MLLNPTVSVILPVYNGERYLSQTIDSILNQSYDDFELIVVDDGSTDNTAKIITSFIHKCSKVRAITCTNSGCPATPKNIGIKEARGKYICFLDHDDLYDHDRTTQLVHGIESHPDWVAAFHDLRFIDENGNHILAETTYLSGPDFIGKARPYLTPIGNDWFECSKELYIYQSLYMGAPHTQSIIIARHRLPDGSISFNQDLIIGEDIDLWIRLSLQGKMGFLNKPLSSYRQHELSITRNQENKLINWLKMHCINYNRVKGSFSKEQQRAYNIKISSGYADLGYLYYRNNDFANSRSAYLDSTRWCISKPGCLGLIKTFMPPPLIALIKSALKRH